VAEAPGVDEGGRVHMRDISLSDKEILLLDGKVNETAQEVINYVKKIDEFANIGDRVYAEIIVRALLKGELTVSYRDISHCSCGATTEYRKITRGRRRGEFDYDHPIRLYGMSFMDGFVIVKGHSEFGFCQKCGEKAKSAILDYIKEHDLPIQIGRSGNDSAWIKENAKICKGCNEQIWEFDMGLEYTIMGDGRYYSKCPKCGAEGGLFASHEPTKKFRMVRRSELRQIKNCWQRAAP
jgi:hypothetical protein